LNLNERNARLEAALKGLMELTAAAYGNQVDRCAQYRVAKDALSFCKADSEAEKKKECRKPVDLSVLIDSGMDVGNCAPINIEWLQPTSDSMNVFAMTKYRYAPRMNYWFSARNFEYPLVLADKLTDAGFVVVLDEYADHVINFMITGLQDGYYWPWECD